MNIAWKLIKQLIKANAQHRKGFKLQEIEDSFVLEQAREEFAELCNAPDDPGEMADLLGVLFHYAIKKGWSMGMLESHLVVKLRMRFTEGKKK